MPASTLYGLIGYPLKHTLSPRMHNAAFAALGIAAEYKPFEIPPEDLASFFSSLDKQSISGLNVTVPYKEKVLDFITIDPESRYLSDLKAVNTVVKREGVWRGYNTDIPGFIRHLKEHIEPRSKRVALLGAGGAAKAVAYALAQAGAARIVLYDTDKPKAQTLVEVMRRSCSYQPISCVDELSDLDIVSKDILINATPVGLKASDPSPVTGDMLHEGLLVYDLVYNPAETRLLKLAKSRGARAVNGLGMLLYQGALAFRHFTGREPPLEVMKQALLEGLKTHDKE